MTNITYDRLYRAPQQFTPASATSPWKTFVEPLGSARADSERAGTVTDQPLEQLALTRDKSDYCWYITEAQSEHAREAELHLTRAGDYFYVYVNGYLAASSPTPLVENRGPIVADGPAVIAANELEEEYIIGGRPHAFQQTFTIPLKAGRNDIAILSCALGMIKGDWQIAMSMDNERKGLWGDVLFDGGPLTGWRTIPFLLGERLALWEPMFPGKPSAWSDGPANSAPLAWHHAEFDAAPAQLSDTAIDWAFDAAGLDKGLVWVNGHLLGRYWTIKARGYGPDLRFHPAAIMGIGEGEPTQGYYHIPTGWLKARNTVVVLSETGAEPGAKHIVTRQN